MNYVVVLVLLGALVPLLESTELCKNNVCNCVEKTVTCVCKKDDDFDHQRLIVPRGYKKLVIANCSEVKLHKHSFHIGSISDVTISNAEAIDIKPEAFKTYSRILGHIKIENSKIRNLEPNSLKEFRSMYLTLNNVDIRHFRKDAMKLGHVQERLIIDNSRIKDIETGAIPRAGPRVVQITNTEIGTIHTNAIGLSSAEFLLDNVTINNVQANAIKVAIYTHHPKQVAILNSNFGYYGKDGIEFVKSYGTNSLKFKHNRVGLLDKGAFDSFTTKTFSEVAVAKNHFLKLRGQATADQNEHYAKSKGNKFECNAALCNYLTKDKFKTYPGKSLFANIAFNKAKCTGPKYVPSSDPIKVYGQFNSSDECIEQFLKWASGKKQMLGDDVNFDDTDNQGL